MSLHDIYYVGVNDYELDLFEGQYPIPNGMAYNSYVICDEKVAVMDSVEVRFAEVWFENIRRVLGEKTPDYLVVQHMEPDHSGSILRFMETWPEAKIVASAKAFNMLKNFFGVDFADRRIVVADGNRMSLGSHDLQFLNAAMIHWPEVMMTYDHTTKTLFSSDAFGKFGTLDTEEEWDCEARRYYFGIVAKFGVAVQNLFRKIAEQELDIQAICPLHGPTLTENIPYYINLYDIWSRYDAESEGVVIAYTSIYGNTKKAVDLLSAELREKGKTVVVHDLARCDVFEAIEDAFRYDKLVLATTTYNGKPFPFMHAFAHHLVSRGYRKRLIAFIENGSWAPMATQNLKNMLAECKDLSYAENGVRILSALNEESTAQIYALAEELCR